MLKQVERVTRNKRIESSRWARSSAALLSLGLAGCSAGLNGCSAAHADPPVAATTAATTATPQSSTVAQQAAPTAAATEQAPPTQVTANERVHRALGAQPEHAELLTGTALTIDFGTVGAAKYTLGGWLTGNIEDGVIDGASTMIVRTPIVKMHLPATSSDATTIELRVRTYRADRLHTYVNGREIASPATSGTAFEVLRIAVPSGAMHAGENLVQFRADSPQTVRGIGRVASAIDWLRVGDETSLALPFPSENTASTGDAIRIANQTAWRFTTEVTPHARLRARLNADPNAQLRVSVSVDGEANVSLGEALTRSEIDLDLSALANKLARIEFRAEGGSVTLDNARIVTLDAAPLTEVRRPKNVLLYLIDTLRADRLKPINPQSRVQTPGLDRFVRGAAIMMGAHTQENWTKPSVTTLLSSLLPWQHNATTTEAVVPEDINLLPEVLGGRGYFTGAFIANGYVSDRFGFKQGWSTYRNYIREGRNSPAQYVAADVLSWLDSRPQEQPFFLYVHTIDPHVPYRPPASFLSMYDDGAYSGPVDFSRDGELLEKIKIGRVRLNDRDKTHLQALYDGEISYHDVHFDSILQALERRGIADETLVVVTADHGEEFWDHGSVGHGHSVWEELLHIPLFVRWPGVTNELTRIDHAVGLVDIMPTILEVLGQEVPSDLAGHSFASILRGQTPAAPRVAVSGFMDGWRTAAAGRWKLVQRGVDRAQLYDLQADPHEQRDLAATHPIALRYVRGLFGLNVGLSEHSAPAATPGGTARPNVAATPRRPAVHQQQTTTIDPETEAQLRALGYVGSSRR